jgi:dipeptidyl aminopeptidase/acylaminoacyl peptidase
MTAFDRLEPQIPELLDELAPARVPDYFDDLLRQIARTRQRPAWSSFERRLPMGVIARTAPVRQVPWRPLLLVALVGLLAAAALVALSGAGKPRLPAPFGPARNGAIVMGVKGDIVMVDPATGRETVIIGGPATDQSPVFSNLGTQVLFKRTASGSTPAVFMADADGSDVRQLISVPTSTQQNLWWDWSADGRRLIYPKYELPIPRTLILDTVTGTTTEPHPGVDQHYALWRPGHDEYVFRSTASGRFGYFLASADGPAVRAIAFPDGGAMSPRMSPDGSKLAYIQGEDNGGPLHLLDIDTGHDRLLTGGSDGEQWSNPQFSPDGTQILAQRLVAEQPDHLALLPVDDPGPAVELRPAPDSSSGGAQAQFSPDGKSVLAFYDDGTLWLFDIAGRSGRQLDRSFAVEPDRTFADFRGTGGAWQRLAP